MSDLKSKLRDRFLAPLRQRTLVLASNKAVVPEKLVKKLEQDLASVVSVLNEYGKQIEAHCNQLKQQESIILKIKADIELIRQSQIQVNQAMGNMINTWKALLEEKSGEIEGL